MGTADNVIAQSARMSGTVRSMTPEVRDLVDKRLNSVCDHIGAAYGATVTLDYQRLYPVLVNHAAQTSFAVSVASGLVGAQNVDANYPMVMGGEDFAFMLEERPGAMIFLGQRERAGLHHPAYDFNDETIPLGWISVVEKALPL